jgi:hypothetical protein
MNLNAFYIFIKYFRESFKHKGKMLCLKVIPVFVVFLLLEIQTFSQDSKVVFSENFDNTSSTEPWSPYFSDGWFYASPLNNLTAVSGRGNVLKVNFPAGAVGSSCGFGNYRIPLDSAYKELYLSWEFFVPSDFDYGFADGLGGGKFFGGFAGGSMPAIPNNDATEVDGWASIFLFQNGFYSTYNYFKGSSYDPSGWPSGDRVANINKGQWQKVTIRLKINDGNQSNGIFEVFNNGVLVYQQTNAKIVNAAHPEYFIEHIYLNSFFGGDGFKYTSPISQFMEFDNLIAFYYPKGSSDYRAGASEKGRTINVPVAGSYHPLPPNKFSPATYSDASGTISSHCGFFQPIQHTGFESSTIQISSASSININVTKFIPDPGLTGSGSKQILNIYKGIGTSRTLVASYSGAGMRLQSHNISGNLATIEWQAGLGINGGFELNYTSDGTGSGRNFTCGNFFANQAYVVVSQKPTAPNNLQITNVDSSSISLKWTDNSVNETGFELQRFDRLGTYINSVTLGANVNTYKDAGLYSNTTYQYKVRAFSGSQFSDFSNTIIVATSLTPPNAPSNLQVISSSSTSVSLIWVDHSNIESNFELQRLNENDALEKSIAIPANTTQYNDNGLTPNANYSYKIRAQNTIGSSAFSNIVKVSNTNSALYIPSDFAIENITESQISLSWVDNNTNEDGYFLTKLDSSGTNIISITTLSENSSGYTDTTLSAGTYYVFRLYAFNNDGNGAIASLEPVMTNYGPIEVPGNLHLKFISAYSIGIAWDGVASAENYYIFRKEDSSDYKLLESILSGSTIYTDNTVNPGHIYKYKIRAYGYTRLSDETAVLTINSLDLVLNPPKNFKVINIKSTSLTLSWEDYSIGESGYVIERTQGNSNNIIIDTVPSNTIQLSDTALNPNTTYTYKIFAYNSDGIITEKAITSAQTLSLNEDGRISDNLLAYYNFNNIDHNTIQDLSDYSYPLNLNITNPEYTSLNQKSTLCIESPTLLYSDTLATKIVKACKASQEITVELWLCASDLNYMPATIISLSKSTENVGFEIRQNSYNVNDKTIEYQALLQSESTFADGMPSLNQDIIYNGNNLNHFVFTHNKTGTEQIYINSILVGQGFKAPSLASWDNNYNLIIGNNQDGTHPFLGSYYLCAIYSDALTDDKIKTNYLAGPYGDAVSGTPKIDLLISPNPVNDICSVKVIRLSDELYFDKLNFKILDNLGNQLLTGYLPYLDTQENKIDLDLSNFNAGIYFIQINLRGEIITTKKIIKTN